MFCEAFSSRTIRDGTAWDEWDCLKSNGTALDGMRLLEAERSGFGRAGFTRNRTV